MKQIERHELIDRIGRELQSRMRYGDIDAYLAAFGVDTKKETSGVNSKWVYVKELLEDAPADVIVRIADELVVPHHYTITTAREVAESTFWDAQHFRLFLSHLSHFKRTAAALQGSLRQYGISSFVAHVDIEPTREWQDEIEAALFSMDALVAILMPGFRESNWTDQEVGVAVGRGVLVVPIIRGVDPYGLIAKYQGLDAKGRSVAQVARSVFEILIASEATRTRMFSCLTDCILNSTSDELAMQRIAVLQSLNDVPSQHLKRLRDGLLQSQVAGKSPRCRLAANELLERFGLVAIGSDTVKAFEPINDDDIPF